MSRAVRAVVLAAGRGSRMRARGADDGRLDAAQAALADRGLKALLPFAGRAYLEYGLDALADAGILEACVVIGPETEAVRAHLARVPLAVRVTFAVQSSPRGSADALLAAESFAGDAPFLVLNADNVYPSADLGRLAALDGPGLVGYAREGLLRGGIPAGRIGAFALLVTDGAGMLRDIVEKPDAATAARLAEARVSMTCWRFDARIFDACRTVAPSARGELELPDAVRVLLGRGVGCTVLPSSSPVLDLSTRADVPVVAAALQNRSR